MTVLRVPGPSRAPVSQPVLDHSRAATVKLVVGYVLMVVVAIAFLYPLWWMVSSAFKPGASILNDPLAFHPGQATLANFRLVFQNIPIGRAFVNTVIVIIIKGTITLVFCPLAGYGFAKFRFPFRDTLFGLVLLTLMLPTLVLIIPLLLEMSQVGWVNTYQALILPGSVDAFSVFWMRQVISQVPDELLDAARIDGCGPFGIFRRIVVPVIRPSIAALAVLTVLNIYNDFVWPVVAVSTESRQTLQVLLYGLSTQVTGGQPGIDLSSLWGELAATCTIATIPLLLVFLVLQKHFIRGLLAGSSR
jgi:multiple sugar transport system permease protein